MYSSDQPEDIDSRKRYLAPTEENIDELIDQGYVAFKKVKERSSSFTIESSFNYSTRTVKEV